MAARGAVPRLHLMQRCPLALSPPAFGPLAQLQPRGANGVANRLYRCSAWTNENVLGLVCLLLSVSCQLSPPAPAPAPAPNWSRRPPRCRRTAGSPAHARFRMHSG